MGAAWSFNSLRTDSVRRGFSISLLTLASSSLVCLSDFVFSSSSQDVYTDCAQNLFSMTHNSVLIEVVSQRSAESECFRDGNRLSNPVLKLAKTQLCRIYISFEYERQV